MPCLRSSPGDLMRSMSSWAPRTRTLRRREGEAHRDGLVRLAAELDVADHVRFLDRFVDLPTLTRAIAAADIYLTPYLNEAQSVSGTLAYSFGMGKPVVSTPYGMRPSCWRTGGACSCPSPTRRRLPMRCSACSRTLRGCSAMREAAYRLGRDFVWARMGERYLELFRQARREPVAPGTVRGAAARPCRVTVAGRRSATGERAWRAAALKLAA